MGSLLHGFHQIVVPTVRINLWRQAEFIAQRNSCFTRQSVSVLQVVQLRYLLNGFCLKVFEILVNSTALNVQSLYLVLDDLKVNLKLNLLLTLCAESFYVCRDPCSKILKSVLKPFYICSQSSNFWLEWSLLSLSRRTLIPSKAILQCHSSILCKHRLNRGFIRGRSRVSLVDSDNFFCRCGRINCRSWNFNLRGNLFGDDRSLFGIFKLSGIWNRVNALILLLAILLQWIAAYIFNDLSFKIWIGRLTFFVWLCLLINYSSLLILGNDRLEGRLRGLRLKEVPNFLVYRAVQLRWFTFL